VTSTEIKTPTQGYGQPERPAIPRRRRRRDLTPYWLILPASVVLIALMGYPLVRLVELSLQEWGLKQIFNPDAGADWIGLRNFRAIVSDDLFRTSVERSLILTVAMVVGSMVVGVGIALVMQRVPAWCRWLMTFALVLAWAVPSFVATEMFAWMTDYNYGVVNWLLGMPRHNWYVNNVTGFSVAVAVVIWGAVPLIAISSYAALGQVSRELIEAARVDGASGGQILRKITLPLIRPIIALLTILSVIWDFQVFAQIWVLRRDNPTPDYYTLGIYAYTKAYYSHAYGYASALAIVVMLILGIIVGIYLKALSKMGNVS
jgi:N,N'-diacetylchitobiose transport system permease protein